MLLVIEDLHRADAATRSLFTFLARIARGQRLAIVGTYQPDAIRRQDPWRVDLDGLDQAPRPPARLTLEALGRDDLARLIEAIEGERPSASGAFGALCAGPTAIPGNPSIGGAET